MLRAISRPILLHFKSKNLAVSSASKTLYFYSSPKSIAVGISSHFTPHFRNSVIKIKASSQFNTRYMSTPVNSPLITEQEVTGNAAPQVELLTSANDDFGGVIVHMKEPMDPQVFISSLRASMLQWRLQGIKGVWIKLPIGHANLVEAAVKEGFWYHHAEKTYLMLVNWIHETACTIPANATHRVGIGAFVINDKREVLVVQEKSGRFRGTGLWKFPTGVVDEGEDISVAAVREVKEETGIDAEFVEVLAFRQSHKAFFGKSDLFFVCMMRPLSFNIQKQEEEIEAAEWMPIEEYAVQPFVQNHGLLKYMIDIGMAAVNGKYAGFLPVPTSSMFAKDHSYLYLNHQDLSKSVNSGNKL